jgi:hypothetical protein
VKDVAAHPSWESIYGNYVWVVAVGRPINLPRSQLSAHYTWGDIVIARPTGENIAVSAGIPRKLPPDLPGSRTSQAWHHWALVAAGPNTTLQGSSSAVQGRTCRTSLAR